MKNIYIYLSCSIIMLGTINSSAQITCLPFTFNFVTVQPSCPNSSNGAAFVTAAGGILPYTFQWDAMANNQTSDTATNLAAGNYSVIVTDSLGCVDTGYVSLSTPATPTPSICMVTVDDNSVNNIVYWDKTSYTNVDSFIIYRDVSAFNYQRIGAVSVDSLSEFIDTSRHVGGATGGGDPNMASYRYKIQILDTCGNYGSLSPFHNTIFMTDNGAGEFNWTVRYNIEGSANPVNNYILMCDTANAGVWGPINMVTGIDTVATDPGFLNHSNIANWRIATAWGVQCSPTRTIINTTRSNIKHGSMAAVGVNQLGIKNEELGIYPNPANDKIEISTKYKVQSIKLFNVLGEMVWNESSAGKFSMTIDVSGFSRGIYTVEVISNNNKVFKKLVVE